MATGHLGRRTPSDFEHTTKYPLRELALPVPRVVERVLLLPTWHWGHDQGQEGSCVGHGAAMERAITNTAQNRLLRLIRPSRRYDPISLWSEAKVVDGFPDTNPGDDNGTTVRAAYDVLRSTGPHRVRAMHLEDRGVPIPLGLRAADDADGVSATRWATTVDEMRAAISHGMPVTIGVSWYGSFDSPEARGREWWIGQGDLGSVRGGHCVCIYGASDARHAFRVKNSWGRSYPLAWLPYTTMARLLHEDGEAALTTDR